MRILCVLGEHNYGDPRRGEGYEFRNFIPALGRLRHEAVPFESRNHAGYPDFAALNRSLLERVEVLRPDVILSVQRDYEIWSETWEILRDHGTAATVNWATDDSWKYEQVSRFLAPCFHAFATTCPEVVSRYRREGYDRVFLTQWAASPETLRPPLPAGECDYPVTFVGTAHGKPRDYIAALARRGLQVLCFGHGWPAGPVPGSQIPDLIRRSVISLNFANSESVWRGIKWQETTQIKARLFEVPGAGGFLLTGWAEGLERYYEPEREVSVFHSLDELAEKARFFLEHPAERDKIAQAGFARTAREHTYDRRFAELLEFTLAQRQRYLKEARRPGNGRLDRARFAEAESRHRLSAPLRLARVLMCRVGSAVWGPIRGPRAARRFLFELSWRLAGRHTFSAAGWPGRMFYAES